MTTPDRPEAPAGEHGSEALIAALIELEHHVGERGWDQPPRLFALVRTDELIAAEPDLAVRQGLRHSRDGGHPDALTAIEQDDFSAGSGAIGDLVDDLTAIVWPETVFGCALSLESSFLPAGADVELPDRPEEAAQLVATHPAREDIRVLVGVTRAGDRHGVGRLVSQPGELLGAADLVPGLVEVLAHTLTGLDPDPEISEPGPPETGPDPDDRRVSNL